jgi:hypothetical protein
MDGAVHPQRIRQLVYDTLVELGADRKTTTNESLLIRNGTYCGHRYRHDDYQAVWFIEEDQIKFYSPPGRLVKLIRPSEVLSQRAA